MAQMTESLARAILNGAGCTRNEIEQLARHFLATPARMAQAWRPIETAESWREVVNCIANNIGESLEGVAHDPQGVVDVISGYLDELFALSQQKGNG